MHVPEKQSFVWCQVQQKESSHWYIDHDTGVNIDPFYYAALYVCVYAFNLALLCV
jgi:hypothetical protein